MSSLKSISSNRKLIGLLSFSTLLWVIVIYQYTTEDLIVAILEAQAIKPISGLHTVDMTESAASYVQTAFAGKIKRGENLYAEFVHKGIEWKEYCQVEPNCPFLLGGYAGAHYVIATTIEEISPSRLRLEAQIFHIRTARKGRKEHDIASPDEVPRVLAKLFATLLRIDPKKIDFSEQAPQIAQTTSEDQFGSLTIESNPTGALVSIAGEPAGQTPLTLEKLNVGEYAVSVKKEHFIPIQRKIMVYPNQHRTIPFDLTSTFGQLEVTSVPEGAEIWLDGQETGKQTPILLEDLTSGEHAITLKHDHYKNLEDSAFVYPTKISKIHLILEGNPGRVQITGTPEGVLVYCDKIFQGYTPINLTLSPGDHTLVLNKKTYQAEASMISLVIDEEKTFEYRLKPEGETPGSGGMVKVDKGHFLMGSSPKDIVVALKLCPSCTQEDLKIELPQRKVLLEAYKIDRYEVTNGEYQKCISAGICLPTPYLNQPKFNEPLQPVVGVTYEMADAYCQWVGKRMPTEAEWEKAARGTDGRLFAWGTESDCTKANHAQGIDYNCSERNPGKPAPVGSYPAGKSPYGAYDMAGNVWEWVSDYFSEEGYNKIPDENPTGAPPGPEEWRVLRGGSWADGLVDLRASSRVCACAAAEYTNALGFRCAGD